MTTTDDTPRRLVQPLLQSKHAEYAILVREIGWVVDAYPNITVATVGDPSRILTTTDQDEAEALARRVMGQYQQFGLPGMASAVHVVAREVTTTYGDWDDGYYLHDPAWSSR